MPNSENKTLLEPGDGVPPPDEYIRIPDPHYAAMGKVADAWADLEFEIDQVIWQFLQTHQSLGACVTAQMVSIHPRMNALRSLARLWEVSEEAIAELGRFYGKAGALADKRNRSIHDKRLIQWNTKEVVRLEVSAKNKLKFEPIPETIESLMKFAADIAELHLWFIRIKESIFAELRAFPDKPRGQLPILTQMKAR